MFLLNELHAGGGGENGCWYTTSCIYHTGEIKKRANEELSVVRLHEVGRVVKVTL